jgi:hypothetical protein
MTSRERVVVVIATALQGEGSWISEGLKFFQILNPI